MSNTEPELVTVALNCSVKVSGTLYSPDDVIRVPESIAKRLVEQKAADRYEVPSEDEAAPEADQIEPSDASETDDDSPDGDEGEDEKPARGRSSRKGKAKDDEEG